MDHPELPRRTVDDWDTASLELVITQGVLNDDVRKLRERVFRDETGFLSDADILTDDDRMGTHLCLYQQGTLVGAVLGVDAEKSSFSARSGILPEQLGGM